MTDQVAPKPLLEAVYEYVPNCPVCGTEGKPVKNAPNLANSCPSCDLIWHNPRFDKNTMDRYYRTGFYMRTVPHDEKFEKMRGAWIAYLIDAFLSDLTIRRCLDVGCGQGFLLAEIQELYGCEVVGLDLYPRMLNAIDDIRDSRDKIDGMFDLICYIHSLEHVYDPHDEMDWALSHLSPGGALLIELPMAKEISLPHPLVFSDDAIQVLMDRHGLTYSKIDRRQVDDALCNIIAMRTSEALPIIGKPTVVSKAAVEVGYHG